MAEELSYRRKWISLADAAARLAKARGDEDEKAARRDLWSALGDNAVSARGVQRDGERVEGSPLDFSLFNRSYDDDDIAELVTKSEVLDWELRPPAAWRVEVNWDEVGIAFGLNNTAPGTEARSVVDQESTSSARLRIKRSQLLAILDGTERPIPEKPFTLLCLLAEKALAGQGASHEEIEKCLWGGRLHLIQRKVSDVVRDLRDALGGEGEHRQELRGLIETRPNHGYRLRLAPAEISLGA